MLAHDERLAVPAMRAVRAPDTADAVMAAHEAFGFLTKRTAGTALAIQTLHTTGIGCIAPKLAQQFSVLILEISECQRIGHRCF
jgi:LDH2 family malate/lactate/ureidoglycolate dehydrogenase